MRKVKLAPSLLSADFGDLRQAISYVEPVADIIHLDVMDGHFVPDITFGPLVVKAIRKITRLPLDVHLMIDQPADFVEDFAAAGADWISFHVEATQHTEDILGLIQGYGKRAGVVINPGTPASYILDYLDLVDFVLVMTVVAGSGGQELIPEALHKVKELKQEAERRKMAIEVEIDGGVKIDNLHTVLSSGADVIVVGSSIYSASDPRQVALDMRRIIDQLS